MTPCLQSSARSVVTALFACCVLSVIAVPPATAADPNANAGKDAGPPYVAIIGSGVDYRKPEIAKRLARDGEGVPIGWDFIDSDATPFDPDPEAAHPHRAFFADTANGSLVVVRAPANDTAKFVQAIGFVSQTPARVVVTPAIGNSAAMLAWVKAAAARFRHLLIVAPAGSGAHDLDQLPTTLNGTEGPVPDPAPPEVAKLRNLIIVTGTPSARANTGQRRVHIAVDVKTGTAQTSAQPSNQGGDASIIAAARVAAIAAQLLAKTPD
ncbi:MAG: hypothetical protein AAFZ05_07775, partial [Pseudomonadota bacterium]